MALNLNYKVILNEAVKQNKEFHPIGLEDREKLQNVLYDMACDIDERCKKHNINIFIAGGSLLGAVRHGNFIPWDDDMDFGVNRNGYEKIKKIFDKVFSDKYEMRCPNSPYPNGNRFMQIYKKETLLENIDSDNPLQPKEISIDIFPYDNVPDNILKKNLKGIKANVLMGIASCVMDYQYPNKLLRNTMEDFDDAKRLLHLRDFVGKVFSFKSAEMWFDEVDSYVQTNKKTKKITSAMGRYHYFKETYLYDDFFPLTKLKFRNHEFYAPRHYKVYLKGNYGSDYMIPPEENQRESHFISKIKV